MNTQQLHWDDFKIAYTVARYQTVSAAAQSLGIHHATVIRRVERLETDLGLTLFERSASGYQPTHQGRLLLQLGNDIEQAFLNLKRKINLNTDFTPEVIQLWVHTKIQDIVIPLLSQFLLKVPHVLFRFVLLEEKETADIHITDPIDFHGDHQVYFCQTELQLAGTETYFLHHHLPEKTTQLQQHRVLDISEGLPVYSKWIAKHHIPHRFILQNLNQLFCAVRSGMGIGCLPIDEINQNASLHPILRDTFSWSYRYHLRVIQPGSLSENLVSLIRFLTMNQNLHTD